ncbi:hypothetical protein GA0074695_3460 [Micromonospora viridifaciens]|uniref:Uncharacterized protein n=1 Tax=Micromonospora viridifaciens TaxID=1881 RepID=A0A1C4XN55_MICVI|nr:hypothetical protein [Micromonospora viridifaciens]SCF09864.1 hypothetical protein GA0074695_3460 [Micromonospora viridifaciens]
MGDLATRFRSTYGASAGHLLLLAGSFAVVGWVVLRLAGEPSAGRMLLWFVGAAIAHDFVLFPVYGLADRVLRGAPGTRAAPPSGPAPLNHLRAPALASGLLFLVYLPGIVRLGRPTYLAASGQDQRPFLGRWLLATAALFLASGVGYAVRWWWARRR